MPRAKARIDFDEIRESLGIPDLPDECDDATYGYAYREALDGGASEEDADAAGLTAEQEAADERWRRHYDAVMTVAERVFGEHGLVLEKYRTGRLARGERPFYRRVAPIESWPDAARKILETINGVGVFHFDSVRAFCASIPDTTRGVVLTHLHWMKRRADVYGDPSPRRQYEREMR